MSFWGADMNVLFTCVAYFTGEVMAQFESDGSELEDIEKAYQECREFLSRDYHSSDVITSLVLAPGDPEEETEVLWYTCDSIEFCTGFEVFYDLSGLWDI